MSYDSRFDAAESEVDRGNPWRFKEEDAPNPLTIEAIEWSEGTTKLGAAEWLNGTDKHGVRWSILVGPAVLKKHLVDGLIERWDEDRQAYVEVDRLGRVKPGEIVSIKYLGMKEGTKYDYPNFAVVRKPAAEPEPAVVASQPSSQLGADDDMPF
jgi:hypothetical protein